MKGTQQCRAPLHRGERGSVRAFPLLEGGRVSRPAPRVAEQMLVSTDYSQHVVARLFDFFTVNAQWQRRLWNVGLSLSLRELDEAIEGQHLRALSVEAVRWLADSIKGHLKGDPGVGSDGERKNLMRLLEGDLAFNGVPHRILR